LAYKFFCIAELLHEAACALPLALEVAPELLLLEMLEQAASPALAVKAVIAATAATAICRIPVLPIPILSIVLVGFCRGQHTPRPVITFYTERAYLVPSSERTVVR
jgi:hypothetical protein